MAKKTKLAKAKPGVPTQKYLDIAEIRDGVVVMKDGTLRAVIMASSINYALKSVDEQQAIVQAYMQFLNSLDFPIQIVVQSRKMNVDNYISQMKGQQAKQTNELLKAQITDYVQFVSELVDIGDIMSKRFYIVVPFDPKSAKQKKFFSRLGSAVSPVFRTKLSRKQFENRKHDLMQRVDLVMGQLASMTVVGAVLDTPSLIELYYSVYNPDVADSQKLTDISQFDLDR